MWVAIKPLMGTTQKNLSDALYYQNFHQLSGIV